MKTIIEFFQKNAWILQSVLGNSIYAIIPIPLIFAFIWRKITNQHKQNILDAFENIESFTGDFGDTENKSNFKNILINTLNRHFQPIDSRELKKNQQ